MVLLFVVAIVNLNVVPTIAANGLSVVWLWLLALLGFFLPQGIAVIELSQQMPGEGGIYLWAKHTFGDFHGFLSGWCYWTNNIFYLPTVLLYFVGISVFVAGPGAEHLADNPAFALTASLILFALLTTLNVLGLGVGKWVNNLGGIGTAIAAVVLIGLGIAAWLGRDAHLAAGSFVPPADIRLLSAFGVICFGLVGLELASVMGDEIKDSRRDLPVAVVWGGIISAVLYVGATLTLLIAIPREQVGVLQGVCRQ
jgi:glutamate:GABA antiporter